MNSILILYCVLLIALILWEEEASQHPSEIKRKKKKATKEEREKEFNSNISGPESNRGKRFLARAFPPSSETLSIESTAEKKEESEEYELLSDDGEYDQFEEDDYDFEFDEDDEGSNGTLFPFPSLLCTHIYLYH